MRVRLSDARSIAVAMLLAIFTLTSSIAYSATALQYQDDMIRGADVIAIVEVKDKQIVKWSGEVITNDRTWGTALFFYEVAVEKTIKGKIPLTPFMAQFTEAADMGLLPPGRRLVFLRESGGIYFPMNFGFAITDGTIEWYKQPFLRGTYGPYYEQAPLAKAVSEIEGFLRESKDGSK